MFNPADDIDAIQASLLRTLASAHRLRIIHRLGVGPCEVNEISRDLGLSQAATSQHLAAMRCGRPRRGRPGRPNDALRAVRPGDPGGLQPHARRARPTALAARRPRRGGRPAAASTHPSSKVGHP